MMRYVCAIIFVTLLSLNNAFSETKNIFEDHKLRSFSPQKKQVKDLFFEVRIQGLIEEVKRTTAITSINDLYYRIYWAHPTQYKIVVEGLPKGFNLLRKQLKDKIKPFVDIIFNEELLKQFERLKFVKDNTKKNTYVHKKTANTISTVFISFSQSGIIEKIISKSPFSKVVSELDHSVKSWSGGKFVLNNMKISQFQNGIKNTRDISIDYGIQGGIGLPKKIILKTSVSNNKKEINTGKMILNFSNYNINTGKPQKIIYGK